MLMLDIIRFVHCANQLGGKEVNGQNMILVILQFLTKRSTVRITNHTQHDVDTACSIQGEVTTTSSAIINGDQEGSL